MGLIPNTKAGKLSFFTAKEEAWIANAVAMGSSVADVTSFSTKLATATAKRAEQVAAMEIAEAATSAADASIDALVQSGVNIIKQVRIKSDTAGLGVFTLAQLPMPTTPTAVTTLGKPSDFTLSLDENGALALKWKCASPRATGTVYQVWRRTTPMAEFKYIGGSGAKEFVDSTLPAGSSQVTYQIQAVRSTAVGPWAQFNVNFGAPGSAATVTEGKAVEIAA